MATEQPELATAKPPETVFRRLRRHWHIAALGLLLMAIGNGAMVLLITFHLLWLTFFGFALLLMPFALLVRNRTVRVACVTLLLLIATGLAVRCESEIYAFGRPAIEGKSSEEEERLYEQIQNGMTRPEIIALLGHPKRVWFDANRQSKGSVECWHYFHDGGWEFVDIFFSAEGQVVDKNIDN
jgi:hypothetical protein